MDVKSIKVRKKSGKKLSVMKTGKVRGNACKVRKFFSFDLLKLSFGCDRDAASIKRDTGTVPVKSMDSLFFVF